MGKLLYILGIFFINWYFFGRGGDSGSGDEVGGGTKVTRCNESHTNQPTNQHQIYYYSLYVAIYLGVLEGERTEKPFAIYHTSKKGVH
jgi:hypothetical protein